MSSRFRALRGFQDILPPESTLWLQLLQEARRLFSLYGFKEILTPLLEPTELFQRSIGESTDIVQKEMYTFTDKAHRSVTLRPEGTAGLVRAYVQHHLWRLPAPQKFFYWGPMFRYERPQKGRLRQFHQLGLEAFGAQEPKMDAELMQALMQYLQGLGLGDLELQLNSIGCPHCRPRYREALKEHFSTVLSELCPDCQRRYELNPLRILDCKVQRCQELRHNAPLSLQHLCSACQEHFQEVKETLRALGVAFAVNPHIVRGLDYYNRTAFEVLSPHLGAQNAVAAGGRYDYLVEDFGGPPTAAIGFAIGLERLAALLSHRAKEASPVVFIASLGREAALEALRLAISLRQQGLYTEQGYDQGSLRSQLRRANRLKARYAIIIGEEELKEGAFQVKDLKEGTSVRLPASAIREFIKRGQG